LKIKKFKSEMLLMNAWLSDFLFGIYLVLAIWFLELFAGQM